MITKCPHCGNEYEIELDQSVGEITIRCPQCRVPFTINNRQAQKTEAARVVVSEVKPVKRNGCLSYLLPFLAGFVAVAIALVVFAVVYRGYQDRHSDMENQRPVQNQSDVRQSPTQEVAPVRPSAHDCYEAGFKAGYTGGPEYKRYGQQDEWCRNLWGVFADYDMLNNNNLYQEFRRGFYSGMEKRKEQQQREEQERYNRNGYY